MTVELTPEQAVFLETLIKAGVMNLCNGQAILNFDSEGTLVDIETRTKVYKRKRITIGLTTVQ